jgi:hypothetical protein
MEGGILYLIQPVEYIGTSIYKIGCSRDKSLKRCKSGYGEGSKYIVIMDCDDPFTLEGKIKKAFNKKFKLFTGREYFEGDETEMITEFLKIAHSCDIIKNNVYKKQSKVLHRKNTEEKTCVDDIVEYKYYCKYCDYVENVLCNIKKHICTQKHKDQSNNDVDIDNYIISVYTCAKCNKTYKNKQTVSSHIKNCHSTLATEEEIQNVVEDDNFSVIIQEIAGVLDKKKFECFFQNFINGKVNSRLANFYKGELEFQKKSIIESMNNKSISINNKSISMNNKSISMNNKSMNMLNYAMTYFKDAPKLEHLDQKTAREMLMYESENGKIIKTHTDENLPKIIAKINEMDRLHEHLGNNIVTRYKKDDPNKQSFWVSDVSRKKFIVNKDDTWKTDNKGVEINKYIINPLLDEVIDIMDTYCKSKSCDIDAMTKEEKNTYADIEKQLLEIKANKGKGKIKKSIIINIMPHFTIDQKKKKWNDLY